MRRKRDQQAANANGLRTMIDEAFFATGLESMV